MRWDFGEAKPELECTRKVEVVIPEDVFAKMFAYVDAVEGEISGMGTVSVKDGVYTVTDVWLLKQECTAASTKIEAAALADLRAEAYAQGKAPEGFQLWWHSHVNMATFWSGTDKSTMAELLVDVPWMLFIVVNKKRSIRSRVEYREPFEIAFENVQTFLETKIGCDEAAIKKEVEEKVTDRTYRYKGTSGRTYDSWRYEPPDAYRKGDVDDRDTPPRGYRTGSVSPAERGEIHWKHLSKGDKRIVRRYALEDEPMCLFYKCTTCRTDGVFVFYSKKLKQLFCLTCAKECVQSWTKNARVTRVGVYVSEEEAKRLAEAAQTPTKDETTQPPAAEPPATPPTQREMDDFYKHGGYY